MRLARFLFRTSAAVVVLAGLLGVLSGGANAGLLAVLNVGIAGGGLSTRLALVFGALIVVRLSSTLASRYLLTRLSQRITAKIRREVSERILDAPLQDVERMGAPRLIASLSKDVDTLTEAMLNIPGIAVNGAILAGCSLYLLFLSPDTFLFVAVTMAAGVGVHRLISRRAVALFAAARNQQDHLFGHFRALTEGVKELKLHRARRQAFFVEDLQPTLDVVARDMTAAITRFGFAFGWSQLLTYVVVGAVIFAFAPMHHLPAKVLTGYVITILYLVGPLGAVIQSLPAFAQAGIALEKLEEIGLSLGAPDRQTGPNAGATATFDPASLTSWRTLQLDGVVHAYRSEDDEQGFVLGPIDLDLRRGELVFITGGNGSGKSTLAKILTGLYVPEQGDIRLDGVAITGDNRDDYRQLFSTVFSDFYLFDRLLGLDADGLDDRARDILRMLRLERLVTVKDGRLSTIRLSQGQRKRLALLTAYLEDRPVYLFDEWASDQDSTFRQVFYTRLLAQLKGEGRTVIVISHDERYFHVADRVVRLDQGRATVVDAAAHAPLQAVS